MGDALFARTARQFVSEARISDGAACEIMSDDHCNTEQSPVSQMPPISIETVFTGPGVIKSHGASPLICKKRRSRLGLQN